MAKDGNFELKVGLFVGMGIIIFFIMVFSIGDVNFARKGYRLNTSFSFVDGVTESSPVRYAGVDVGHVECLKIVRNDGTGDTRVLVTLWIDENDKKIETDSVATINTLGLLGEKYIEIFPGNIKNGILADNAMITGRDPVVMRDVTEKLNHLAGSVNVIVDRLKDGKGTVGKLLTDDAIYDDLEDFVADIKKHPWKLLHKPRNS